MKEKKCGTYSIGTISGKSSKKSSSDPCRDLSPKVGWEYFPGSNYVKPHLPGKGFFSNPAVLLGWIEGRKRAGYSFLIVGDYEFILRSENGLLNLDWV